MAAPVKMLQTVDAEDDDSTDSDEDISSSEEELETTSWAKIYKSLQLTQRSRERLDSQEVLHIAAGAVVNGDFVNGVNLYSLGLSCVCKELHRQKACGLVSGSKARQVGFDARLLKYALETCAQDSEKLALISREFRGKFSKVVGEIVEFCDDLSLVDAGLLQAAASLYFSLKNKQKAFHLTARALHLNPKSISLQEMFENICCHLVERWHFVMLNDKGRNLAYQQAIRAVLGQVDRKAVVCDVGCGTGLLSLIACQHLDNGQVFAIEKSNSMCEVAHSVFSANLEPSQLSKITLINKMSSHMSVPRDMPHRADVLVTETFDAGLFGEGILPTLCHAWSHLLKNSPGEKGQVIPGRAELYMQAVECEAVLTESRFLGQFVGINTSGIHLSGVTGLCQADPYAAQDLKHLSRGYRTLSEPLKFMDVDFNDSEELTRLNKGQIQETDLRVSSPGRLDAIAVWFSLHLSDCVEILTHTDCGGCWEQAVFPVHPFKIQMQPLSRGKTCDLNVQAGDILKVVNGLVGTKLCMDVSAILKPHEAGISCNPQSPQFLHDPDVWQAQSVYCLSCKEIKVLNNMTLHSAQHKQMQELFALMKKDNSDVNFIHLNDGFSPLCLQAIKSGFRQASMWVQGQCQRALLRRLMTLNEIDPHKLKLIEDTSDGESGLKSEQGFEDTEPTPLSDITTPCERAVVVMCDLVDTQGRIVEHLQCQQEVLRHQLSSYVRATVSPCRVDVCGVLVDSEHLLQLSRVQSDDNTLGFNIGQFINRYTTRNHQDISLRTLPHTKLSEPFTMFTIDMFKLLAIPEVATAAELRTPNVGAADEPPEIQQDPVSASTSLRQSDGASLACLQPGHNKNELLKLHQVFDSKSHPASCTPIQNVSVGAEFASLAESGNASQEVHGSDPHLMASSDFKADINHDCCKRQKLLQQDDTTEVIVSKHAKQGSVSVEMLDGAADTKLDFKSVGDRECNVRQFSAMRKSKASCLKEKAESSRLSVPESDAKQSKKRSSNCQLEQQDREDGGCSPDRKRGRLTSLGGDEGSDEFLDGDFNSEKGELSQSVHLKVPIVHCGHVTALIYWFDLHLSHTCTISTSDPAHHWNQAAIMSVPSQTQNVAPGDVLSLFCQMDGSAISFLVE
ncbi:hypothetical protein BsWGS_27140 [Bradybaena similaris]